MKKIIFGLIFCTSLNVYSQPFVGLSGLANSPTKENNFYDLGGGIAVQGGYRFGNNLDVGVSGLKSWILLGNQTGNQIEVKGFVKYYISKKFSVFPFVGLSGGVYGMSINPSDTHKYWTGLMAMPMVGFEAGAKNNGLAFEMSIGYKLYDMTEMVENYGPIIKIDVLSAKVGLKYRF